MRYSSIFIPNLFLYSLKKYQMQILYKQIFQIITRPEANMLDYFTI